MTSKRTSRSTSRAGAMASTSWTRQSKLWITSILGVLLVASNLSGVEAVPVAAAATANTGIRTVTLYKPQPTKTVFATQTLTKTVNCPSKSTTRPPTTTTKKPTSTTITTTRRTSTSSSSTRRPTTSPTSSTGIIKTTGTIPSTTFTTTFTLPSSTRSTSTATSSIPFYERNLNTIKRIYNLTIYPNQVPIIVAGGAAVPPGLFSANATGRIIPVGNFTDFEDSIEYFFALPPIPASNSNGAAFTHFWIPQFASSCPEVASSTVYLTAAVADPKRNDTGRIVTYLKQTGFWRFNEAGEVINYDLDLIQLEDFTSILTSTDFHDPFSQRVLIAGLCQQTMQRCTGPNQQYDNVTQCVEELTEKDFGTFNEVWSDTVVCRLVHILLTYVRPNIHCPHVGPSGGMKVCYNARKDFCDQ